MRIRFTLNGKPAEVTAAPDEMLLPVLRRLGCKSIKCACDSTNCGACTVWVDGKPMLSCAYPAARAEGAEITTLEGLQQEAASFAAFMAEQGADQCGFCNPGFVMNVLAMRRELKNPTDEDVRVWLAGNLCRCTGFFSQHRAIRQWLQHMEKEEAQ